EQQFGELRAQLAAAAKATADQDGARERAHLDLLRSIAEERRLVADLRSRAEQVLTSLDSEQRGPSPATARLQAENARLLPENARLQRELARPPSAPAPAPTGKRTTAAARPVMARAGARVSPRTPPGVPAAAAARACRATGR